MSSTQQAQCLRVVPTTTSMSSALRLPTIQAKRVIKFSPSQINKIVMMSSKDQRLVNSSSNVVTDTSCVSDRLSTTISTQLEADHSAPLSLQQISGLFDIDHDAQLAQTGPMTTDEFPNDLLDFKMTTESEETATGKTCIKPKSKFAQRLSQANLKIKVPERQNTSEFLNTASCLSATLQPLNTADKLILNLNLDEDLELAKLITPTTEKECFKLLHSIPTASLTMASQPTAQSAHIISSDQMYQSIGMTEHELMKFINPSPQILKSGSVKLVNPFISEMSGNLKLNNDNVQPVITIELANDDMDKSKHQSSSIYQDHVYGSSKRKFSMDDNTQDSFASSSVDEHSGVKKKRVRGIYRADDVTNMEEYHNYLERRKKNNMSSKVSRANKKKAFYEMDSMADKLEADNQMLREKSEKLSQAIEMLKKYLFQMYAENKKAAS